MLQKLYRVAGLQRRLAYNLVMSFAANDRIDELRQSIWMAADSLRAVQAARAVHATDRCSSTRLLGRLVSRSDERSTSADRARSDVMHPARPVR